MTLPTASSLHRALACPGSALLPRTHRTGPQAEAGTAHHAERALEPPDGFRAEVSYAWDWTTDRARETGRNRAYHDLAPTEFAGTADQVAILDGEAVIVDLKTGRGAIAKPAKNPQLGFLALAVCRAHGLDRATVALQYEHEDGSTYRDSATLDAMDLDLWAETLRRLAERLERGAAKPVPDTAMGDHCRYCPAMPACPAMRGLTVRMAGEPVALGTELEALLTPETAAEAYRRVKVMREVIGLVEEALERFAATSPIDLGDGRVFGPVEQAREYVDGALAHDVLAARYGEDVASAACEIATSKAAIRRALSDHVSKGKVAAAERDVLEAVREMGGIEKRVSTAVKEHKAKERV